MVSVMIELLEYVTEETVLRRHSEKSAPFIRRFFTDAGTNIVQAFNDADNRRSGYIFFQNAAENAGRYFMFVTAQVNPGPADEVRFARQFTSFQWFTGTFMGRFGVVGAHGDICEPE